MADVVCDTSFLIHLASGRATNADRLGEEIGQISFLVPSVVEGELRALCNDPAKRAAAEAALRHAGGLGRVEVPGTFADDAILEYASDHRCIVATMDRELKRRVRGRGGSVMSFASDRIVLEC